MMCLSGCQNVKQSNIEERLPHDAEIVDIEPNSEDDIANVEIPEYENEISESRILKFVDVFGEEYETEIIETVAKTEYDNAKFRAEEEKLYYEDDRYTSRLGIDVSHYQGNVNWDKVKAAGYEFVIVRLGYRGYGQAGNMKVDKTFAKNIEGAQAAGLDVGIYFYSQAINEEEAIEEAEFVLKNLGDYPLQLPIVYDPENVLDDVARTDDVTGDQFTKNTITFCERIIEAGYQPMVYSNMLWEAFQFDMTQIEQYPIWYADYEKYPQTPYAYEMWQYSNTGHVDGIASEVDLNIQFIKK